MDEIKDKKLNKDKLKKLILEIYEQISNQPQEQNKASQKDILKQNTNKHLRMLKLLKATIDQTGTSPEIKKMVDEFKKTNTSTFIQQVLGVKDNITVRVKAALEDPIKLIEDIINEIIKQTITNAKQKLVQEGYVFSEEDLHSFFHDEEAKMEKHKAKMKKKFGPTKPTLNSTYLPK